MKKHNVKYSFIISNTDRSDKNGTHWWTILDLHPENQIFLFDSFRLKGLKNYITKDDKKTNDKILLGFQRFKHADQKLTLVQANISRVKYKKIAKKELGKLSTTAKDLFQFFNDFGKLHHVTDEVTVYFLYDQIQKIKTDACGMFQLYFYKNLFMPSYKSSIINNEKLTNNNIWKILNKIFMLNKEKNEEKLKCSFVKTI